MYVHLVNCFFVKKIDMRKQEPRMTKLPRLFMHNIIVLVVRVQSILYFLRMRFMVFNATFNNISVISF